MTDSLADDRILHFDSLDSTSSEAQRLAADGARGPLWVQADVQTAGRGRRGRHWVSEPGNLYASLLTAPSGPRAGLSRVSFVAALAVYDALVEAGAPAGRLACKWPNDVMADDCKIAGILLESDADLVIVGIGVNLAHAPGDQRRPTTSLQAAFGIVLSPRAMLEMLDACMQRRLAAYARDGFAPLRADWVARAWRLGAHVEAESGGQRIRGDFAGLADSGALQIRLADGGVRDILAGDVSFGVVED